MLRGAARALLLPAAPLCFNIIIAMLPYAPCHCRYTMFRDTFAYFMPPLFRALLQSFIAVSATPARVMLLDIAYALAEVVCRRCRRRYLSPTLTQRCPPPLTCVVLLHWGPRYPTMGRRQSRSRLSVRLGWSTAMLNLVQHVALVFRKNLLLGGGGCPWGWGSVM